MGERLAYVEKGKGKDVVLLHGFCESKAIWQQLMSDLSPQARFLAPDLPGFGENPAIHGSISIDEYAAWIAAWMDKQGVSQAKIIGHSLGGYVALALAEKFPEKVSGLCLFHSTARADTAEKQAIRDKTVDFLEANGVSIFVKNFIPSLFASSQQEHLHDTIGEVIRMASQTPDTTAIAVTRAMRDRPERLAVLEKANFSCLFIGGYEDTAVPMQDVKAQSKLPASADLLLLKDCGHMGMYEQPHACSKAISNFIGQ